MRIKVLRQTRVVKDNNEFTHTKIVNSETGELIKGIIKAEMSIDAYGHDELKLTFASFDIEAEFLNEEILTESK